MADRDKHIISVLQLTDPHILATPEERLLGVDTAYYLDTVLRMATSSGQHYDFCLVTGDLVQIPSADSYRRIVSLLQKFNLKFTCLPGNHDEPDLMHSTLNSNNINCLRHILLDNWQIICLNSAKPGSDGGYLSTEELSWLERHLADYPEHFALIAVHHHCLPAKSQWLDTMMIENSNDLIAIARRYQNAKLVVNGHIHQETTQKLNGLSLLSSPSTCFQFKPFSDHFSLDYSSPGYRHIELNYDGTYQTAVHRLAEPVQGLTHDPQGY